MAASDVLVIYYLVGSILSLMASLFVIFSYLKFKELRQHPSSMIFWRSCYDVVFSVQIIVLFANESAKEHCDVLSALFQFSVLGSQSWYAMVAYDLYTSLRNPFTDPKANVKKAHIFVWTTSILSGIALPAFSQAGYRHGMQLCWTKFQQNNFNPLNWFLFFIPTLLYYVSSFAITIFAAFRLRRGLKNTFSVRLRVLRNGARYTAAFCLYWTIAEILYFLIYQTERTQSPQEQLLPPSSDKVPLYATFALTMGVRGFIDVGVWMINQDVVATYHRWWHGGASVKEPLELNRQLRREVLTYSTQGICASVDSVAQTPFKDTPPGIHLYPQTLDPPEDSPAAKHELLRPAGEDDAAPVPFLDFAPIVFRYLRYKFGINEEAYKLSIKGDTDAMIEKYTEGRSGSFFYFSEDGEYIVKTLSKSEAIFLLQSFLPAYVDYMSKNPHSMITKFLGFHSIKLYTLTLYFVVMQSVFLTTRQIHERYDLKGSWIDRHAKDPNPAHGVLKDCDLTKTLQLADSDREKFLTTCKKDSDFLTSCNIMDYSLLLGIHNTQQLLHLEPAIAARRSVSPSGSSLSIGSADERKDVVQPFFQATDGGIKARVIEGPGIYFFGIIDILQEYNTNKKLERFFKVYFRCKSSDGVSVVPPNMYSWRFVKAMHKITQPFDYSSTSVGLAADKAEKAAAEAKRTLEAKARTAQRLATVTRGASMNQHQYNNAVSALTTSALTTNNDAISTLATIGEYKSTTSSDTTSGTSATSQPQAHGSPGGIAMSSPSSRTSSSSSTSMNNMANGGTSLGSIREISESDAMPPVDIGGSVTVDVRTQQQQQHATNTDTDSPTKSMSERSLLSGRAGDASDTLV